MKTLLTFSLCLFAIVAHAANPSTKSFRATGGLVVTSNDVTGIITYDGSAIVGSTNAPASSTSAGRGMSNLVWSRVLHVDSLFGTNATAIRGDASKPWRDVHWAHSNAVAGDTVFIRPGYYDLGTNHIRGTPGVSIVGTASKGVTIEGTGGLLTSGPVIGAASTQLVSNVRLVSVAAGNTYHAGWGAVNGINAAFTNARLDNVEIVSDTDGIYISAQVPCYGRVYNSLIETRWDCILTAGNSNHVFQIYNSSATSDPSLNSGGAITNTADFGNDSATCLRNGSGVLEVYGGTYTATNGGLGGTVVVTPDNSNTHTNYTRLYGVRLVAAGTDTTARILAGNQATSGFVYEYGGEPQFTQPTAGTYSALYFDGVINVTNAINRTVTLPNIAPANRPGLWDGLRITIHDRAQIAATTNIFISAVGAQRINETFVTTNISVNGGMMELVARGTNWYVVNLGSIGGSGTPAGANFEVQFNNAGAFGATDDFRFLSSGSQLQIVNDAVPGEVDINGEGFISQGVGGQALAFGLGGRTNVLINQYGAVIVRPITGIGTNLFQVEGTNQVPVVSVDSNGVFKAVEIKVIGGAAGSIALSDTDASHAVSFVAAGTMSSNIVFTFPTGVSNGYFRITSVTDSNFTVSFDTPAGGGSLVTNDNQFGASTTLTIKDGVNVTNPVFNGFLEFKEFAGGAVGWSNQIAGTLSLFLTDSTDDFWGVHGQLFVGDRVSANTLTVSNMPGSGPIVAIDAGGATYRTNSGNFSTNSDGSANFTGPGPVIIAQTNYPGMSNTFSLIVSNSFTAPSNTVQDAGIALDTSAFSTGASGTNFRPRGEWRYIPTIAAAGTHGGTHVWQSRTNVNGPATTNMTLTSAGAISAAGGGFIVTSSGATTVASLSSAGSLTANSSSVIGWSARSSLNSPFDGTVQLYNAAQTDFYGIHFGVQRQTNSYLQILSSSTGASNSTINFRSGNTNTWLNVGVGSLAVTNSVWITNGVLVVGPNGGSISNILTASATLDFPSTVAGTVSDLPITLAGASDGDVVALGEPSGSIGPLTGVYNAWASNGVVYVRFANNNLVTAQDPASGTFKVVVTKF